MRVSLNLGLSLAAHYALTQQSNAKAEEMIEDDYAAIDKKRQRRVCCCIQLLDAMRT